MVYKIRDLSILTIDTARTDATIIAAEGQAAPNPSAASRLCDRLIALLETTLVQLQRLRRRLG